MNWTLEFTKQSAKDAVKLKRAGLWKKAEKLLIVLENNPFQNPPPFEKLIGDLAGASFTANKYFGIGLFIQFLKNEKSSAFSECGRITNKDIYHSSFIIYQMKMLNGK